MLIIIEGQFKDTGQKHYINKKHIDDSLRRTRVMDNATRFSCKSEAKLYLDELSVNNQRFNECEYTYVEVIGNIYENPELLKGE